MRVILTSFYSLTVSLIWLHKVGESAPALNIEQSPAYLVMRISRGSSADSLSCIDDKRSAVL